MTKSVWFLVLAAAALPGCKKSGGGGGGGGGGGAWLVGDTGLMANLDGAQPAGGYELGATEQLDAIACRNAGEAWVVGEHATLLYTDDGGDTWAAQTGLPTAGDTHLRTVATQDNGPVFVGGDGAFLVTLDGATWRNEVSDATSFRSMSAGWDTDGVLAISEDGGFWRYTSDAGLVRRTTLPGARAVHQSFGGDMVLIAGTGLWRSTNGGATFQALAVDPGSVFDDVHVNADGSGVAVGAGGAIANIDAFGGVTVQRVGDADLHTVHIHHDTTGYAAGDDGTVLMTSDLGRTWRPGPNVGRTVRGVDEIGFGHR